MIFDQNNVKTKRKKIERQIQKVIINLNKLALKKLE